MSVSIKVLPTADEHVGLVHPVDGALEADGSVWTYDAWTEARIQEQLIRRFEVGADDTVLADAAAQADAKAAKPKTQQAAA
ncbi:hypothetical protein MKK84_27215 [Methylobacterium sp. E-065]|uniref:hypothetical protein n=1 Tax=Methylobacterium sp. E-065 TaxID=2836583 RepID=UPI001FBA5A3E|nr:hypothetical protein [Methylobacterium sp. E-065]MCJ2021069.1 hypothetical protein [Methylobacterium sp. E-065]